MGRLEQFLFRNRFEVNQRGENLIKTDPKGAQQQNEAGDSIDPVRVGF